MFGIAGSQRSGKSTTAKLVAEKMGILYHPVSITATMKEGGFDPVADLSLEDRIAGQEYVLARHLHDLNTLKRPCVVDRTPLDMLAYMLGEITMHNTPEPFWDRIHNYAEQAIEMTDLYYESIICLRPLDTYEVHPDKPPPNVGYQWMIQYLIEGSARKCDQCAVGHAETTDLQTRVDGITGVFTKRLAKLAKVQADFYSN